MDKGTLFVWFPASGRWLPATWAGAAVCAIEKGLEVAYGTAPPRRPGLTYTHTPELWRSYAWLHFVDTIAAAPGERHRLGSCTPKN